MATQITKWKSDTGIEYDTEVEALRADIRFWKDKYKQLEDKVKELQQRFKQRKEPDRLSSSGGGGHD